RLNADRPEARSALANFYARRGLSAEAEAEYKAALRLSPHYPPAAINLADLYNRLGGNQEGESVLPSAIGAAPQDAGLHHALGLALVRLKRQDDALDEFRRATEIEPSRARYAYVYAVALHSKGRASDAIAVLEGSLARDPNDREALSALVSFNRDAGQIATALGYAERLARLAPNDRDLANLIQ